MWAGWHLRIYSTFCDRTDEFWCAPLYCKSFFRKVLKNSSFWSSWCWIATLLLRNGESGIPRGWIDLLLLKNLGPACPVLHSRATCLLCRAIFAVMCSVFGSATKGLEMLLISSNWKAMFPLSDNTCLAAVSYSCSLCMARRRKLGRKYVLRPRKHTNGFSLLTSHCQNCIVKLCICVCVCI